MRSALYALGALGLLARVALWWVSEGSNDIRTWEDFGWQVAREGLGRTYRISLFFNHPPLMGLWAGASALMADRFGLTFAHVFKLPGVLAEVATALLLVRVVRVRGRADLAPMAFAAYGLALAPILITGFHGNTDPLYWFLSLLATYWLVSKNAPFLAGLAIGAALNVKLIPLFLAIALAGLCLDWRRLARYVAGIVLTLLPPMLIVATFTHGQRLAFLRHVIGYRSMPAPWGVEFLVRMAHDGLVGISPGLAHLIRAAGDVYLRIGGPLLIALVVALVLWQWLDARRRLDGYALAALSCVAFLVFASGFGVQYAGTAAALLVVWSPRKGFISASLFGVLLAWVYLSYITTWTPIYSEHLEWPASTACVSFIPWAYLVWMMWDLIRSAGREGAPLGGKQERGTDRFPVQGGGDAEAPPPNE